MLATLRNFIRQRPSLVPDTISAAAHGIKREESLREIIRNLQDAFATIQLTEQLRIGEQRTNDDLMWSALRMSGEGPWGMVPFGVVEAQLEAKQNGVALREGTTLTTSAQGAYGDIELALQNVAWRREINLSWLEFSRWGIQQIILISRLYYLKNPMIQRGCNVAAAYVFGRGCEVSSNDEAANQVLDDFFERNKKTLGQNALMELEKRKWYDGNLFFAFFTDKNTGDVDVRTIDAVEIQEIVTDPDDSDSIQYYKRIWTTKVFNLANGQQETKGQTAWYPALNYNPDKKPAKIGNDPVFWDSPILHRKTGGVAKWRFGCPPVYAALDPARSAMDFLNACMTIRQSLAQFSMMITTKGGQQAMQGVKSQLSTTVGPNASLWDQNPTAVDASVFVSGPGTKLEAFNTKGAGGTMDDVRQFKLLICMIFGIPESFLADMNTSNLATATSLDRPTELGFMAKQEEWREDLVTMATYALTQSTYKPSGKLREAKWGTSNIPTDLRICEAPRHQNESGYWIYEAPAKPKAGATEKDARDEKMTVMVNFPTIIESDVPAQVEAVVHALTLGSRMGDITGIDEKEGFRLLYKLLGVENSDELLESQFPTSGPNAYDPIRTKDDPSGQNPAEGPEDTQQPGQGAPGSAPPKAGKAAGKNVKEALRRVVRAFQIYEASQEDGESTRPLTGDRP